MTTDEGTYPFAQARDYNEGRVRPIRLVGVHATASGEGSRVAESIQRTWTTDDGRLASAHTIGDDDSIVRCVHDKDTAFAAKHANADGLHHEIVGQATQTDAQWADDFSKKAIENAALVVGRWCVRYKIPVRRLTVEQLRDGKSRGIAGHADIQAAFPSTGHTDPGPHFPWTAFLHAVQAVVDQLTGTKHTPVPNPYPTPSLNGRAYLGQGGNITATEAKWVQWVCSAEQTGKAGPDFGPMVAAAQKHLGLSPADGKVGKSTLAAFAKVQH